MNIDWDKQQGLLPAIIQDATTRQVLMLGYMNEASYQKTAASGLVTFYSRSRQALWCKGETSGNYLRVVDIMMDCDVDTVLITVNPEGPTCHKGTVSCFSTDNVSSVGELGRLASVIAERANSQDESSYTVQLLSSGVKRIAQKVGEEGVEVALAAVAGDPVEIKNEVADLLYHILVLLQASKITLDEVMTLLSERSQIVV